MNKNICENTGCNFNDQGKCIQVGYQLNGLNLCPNYKRERKSADELYEGLFVEGGKQDGEGNNSTG